MECQFYFLFYVNYILCCLQMYSRKSLMFTFMTKCFLKSLWQKKTQDTGQLLRKIIPYEQYNFH